VNGPCLPGSRPAAAFTAATSVVCPRNDGVLDDVLRGEHRGAATMTVFSPEFRSFILFCGERAQRRRGEASTPRAAADNNAIRLTWKVSDWMMYATSAAMKGQQRRLCELMRRRWAELRRFCSRFRRIFIVMLKLLAGVVARHWSAAKQSSGNKKKVGLLRGACHRRAFARPVGSQDDGPHI